MYIQMKARSLNLLRTKCTEMCSYRGTRPEKAASGVEDDPDPARGKQTTGQELPATAREYIMRNARLEETQAGIKIARRNINNLRYADDTTFMAESEEELKSLLMNVKVETEKVGLKLNIQKTKIMASGLITSWEIDGETVETVSDFIFWGLQNHCRW
ncbi:hypothetical protein ABFV05_015476 [Capra hircus]